MSNVKKIRKMYEEYLRENVGEMSKKDVIEQFVQTVLAVTNLGEPEVFKNIVDVLLKYERRKALLASGEKQEGLTPNFGEELDFTSMFKPKDFGELQHQLKLLSKNESLSMEDVFTATKVASALRTYMFDVETPWVGTIDGVLCFSWSATKSKVAVLSFIQGVAQLETTISEHVEIIELDEDYRVEEKDIVALLYLAHEAVS